MMKVLLFPFNEDTELLAKHVSEKYQLVAISSYREDASKLAKFQKETAIYCSVNFEDCLTRAEAVVFANNTRVRKFSGYEEKIETALKAGLDVYICASLLEELNMDETTGKIHVLQKKNQLEKVEGNKLKEISIPILSVMGIGVNCSKFKLQLIIKTLLENKGYKVLAICSNPLGWLAGMDILPGFLFTNQLSLEEKIRIFNRWIYKLQKNKDYDLILLGCPGGILPLNEFESNHYGEVPLVITNAVIIDEGILDVYRDIKKDKSTLDKLSNLCQIKYNTFIQRFVMSDNYYKINYEAKEIKYYKSTEIYQSWVEVECEGYNLVVIENEVELEKQVDAILSGFESNFFSI